MSTTSEQTRGTGYLSEESKKTFTTVAGVLGALFFVLQFVGPMVAMFALMPGMLATMDFSTYDVEGSALFRGEFYLVESRERLGTERDGSSRTRLVKLGAEDIEEVARLEGWKPQLLADGERLWLVSSDRMAVLDGQRVVQLDVRETLGDISPPFLLQGRPAVVESRPEGTNLLAWTGGGWTKLRTLQSVGNACCIQFLATGDEIAVFRSQGDSLYARRLDDAEGRWTVVASRPSQWRAFLKNESLAVAVVSSTDGLRILEPDGDRWRSTPLAAEGLGFLGGIGVFQARPKGPLTVISSGFPGSVKVRTWDGSRFGDEKRFGRSAPFPSQMMTMIWLPQLGAPLLSLALAVILSWLMRVHRVGVYVHEGKEIQHAALTRRAISQVVDAIFLAGPGVFLVSRFLRAFSDPEELFGSDWGPFRFFGFIAAAMAWAFLVFLLFSLSEGLWGVTPGKWLTGIRVIGMDLRPCGIGRALVRNLLKLVDGFFNFLIGILMVAYTQDWQRLGDLAARTIVIRTPPGGLKTLRLTGPVWVR